MFNNLITTHLFHYLHLRDYTNLSFSAKHLSTICTESLVHSVRRSGLFANTLNWDEPDFHIQSKQRIQFWEHCLHVNEITDEYIVEEYDSKSSSEGELGEIQRDLNRTFPQHPLFEKIGGEGQQSLGRILRALRQTYPQVGYSQGMNFVAGVFLILVSSTHQSTTTSTARTTTTTTPYTTLPVQTATRFDLVATKTEYVQKVRTRPTITKTNTTTKTNTQIQTQTKPILSPETRVFKMMCALITRNGMDQMWSPGMPGLKIKIHQLNEILQLKLPRLHRHMEEEGLMPDFFASKWFLTLHTYTLPLQLVCIVWDAFVMDGWKAIFRGGLALLKQREVRLLELDMGEIATLFNKKVGLPKSPARKTNTTRNTRNRNSKNSSNTTNRRIPRTTLETESLKKAYYQCYQTIKVTRSMLLRSERTYKRQRLFEMMKWNNGDTDTTTFSSSSTFSMHVYDDPSSSSLLGPGAKSKVEKEYNAIENLMKQETFKLRSSLELVESALLNTSSRLNIVRHWNRTLFADLQNNQDRKELLASQFEFFRQQKDSSIIVPNLFTKIESTTRAIQKNTSDLNQCTSERLLLEVKTDDLEIQKSSLHHSLLSRIEKGENQLGELIERLFLEFKLV